MQPCSHANRPVASVSAGSVGESPEQVEQHRGVAPENGHSVETGHRYYDRNGFLVRRDLIFENELRRSFVVNDGCAKAASD